MRDFARALALAGALCAVGVAAPIAWIVWQNNCCSLRSPALAVEIRWAGAALDELALAHPPAVVPVYSEPLLHVIAPPLNVLPRPRPTATVLLLAEARASLGMGPRELGVRPTLWCADAINTWLKRVGLKGTGSALAISFKQWGRPAKASAGVVGLMPRRGGSGHVVVLARVRGKLVDTYSPNGGRNKVRYATYPLKRFTAFRAPAA